MVYHASISAKAVVPNLENLEILGGFGFKKFTQFVNGFLSSCKLHVYAYL